MQNATLICGNCGKDVAASDVTCPHCGVLLAAYASPTGSTVAHMYESSEPIADAVPEAEMYVPDPAPPIVIPDEVEIASTAPRPLFDTQLTIEEISKAAEGDHEESLVVVSEKKITTKPTVFDVPDYAKPPSDAAPVQILDGGDEDLIARATDEPSRSEPAASQASRKNEDVSPTNATAQSRVKSKQPSQPGPKSPKPDGGEQDEPDEPEPAGSSESWLYDLSQSGPAPKPKREPRKPREPRDRPEPVRTTTLAPGKKRGTTEDYLRKLHDETGFDSDHSQLSKPVETRTGTGFTPGLSNTKQTDSLKNSRKGCLNAVYMVLIFMWFGVGISILNGHLNTGLVMAAIVFSFLARFLNKPLPNERT